MSIQNVLHNLNEGYYPDHGHCIVKYSGDKSKALATVDGKLHTFRKVDGVYTHESTLEPGNLVNKPTGKYATSYDISEDGSTIVIGDTKWASDTGCLFVYTKVEHPITWLNSSILSTVGAERTSLGSQVSVSRDGLTICGSTESLNRVYCYRSCGGVFKIVKVLKDFESTKFDGVEGVTLKLDAIDVALDGKSVHVHLSHPHTHATVIRTYQI